MHKNILQSKSPMVQNQQIHNKTQTMSCNLKKRRVTLAIPISSPGEGEQINKRRASCFLKPDKSPPF